jgi:hypothetical protein
MNYESKLKEVQKHFNFKLIEDFHRPDYAIYSESTADGYEVFIAHEPDSQINISDDVFYYDSDLSERLEEVIRDYGGLEEYIIYVDDLEYDWIEYAIDELYDEISEEEDEEE